MRLNFYRFLKCSVAVAMLALLGCATEPPVDDGFGKPALVVHYEQAPNLWEVLGKQFTLPDESEEQPEVEMQIRWYMTHPLYLQRLAESAQPYLYYIYQQVRARHLPAELTLLPMIESAYDPYALNAGSGASGLWQMMPGTASGLGVRVNWWYDGRRDVVASTKAALDYMVYLGNFFNGHWLLAIAAYDSGPGTISDAMAINQREGKPDDFWALPLNQETRNYVPKLLALATIIKYPHRYPVDLPVVPDAPYLAEVDVGSQIDLAQAAKMAGMSLQELSSLNPGFNRWATDPNGSHELVLPITHVERFEAALDHTPTKERVSWYHYQVKARDTLSSIAKEFHTTVVLIQKVNHLAGNMLQVGEGLLIPSSKNGVVLPASAMSPHHLPETPVINHVVQAHETLWTISKEYHVTPKELRFWNNLGSSNALKPGTTLTIWPPKKTSVAMAKGVPPRHLIQPSYIPAHAISPKYTKVKMLARGYLVMPGDTLYSVSGRFHVSVHRLRAANHLRNDTLHPGEALVIP